MIFPVCALRVRFPLGVCPSPFALSDSSISLRPSLMESLIIWNGFGEAGCDSGCASSSEEMGVFGCCPTRHIQSGSVLCMPCSRGRRRGFAAEEVDRRGCAAEEVARRGCAAEEAEGSSMSQGLRHSAAFSEEAEGLSMSKGLGLECFSPRQAMKCMHISMACSCRLAQPWTDSSLALWLRFHCDQWRALVRVLTFTPP